MIYMILDVDARIMVPTHRQTLDFGAHSIQCSSTEASMQNAMSPNIKISVTGPHLLGAKLRNDIPPSPHVGTV